MLFLVLFSECADLVNCQLSLHLFCLCSLFAILGVYFPVVQTARGLSVDQGADCVGGSVRRAPALITAFVQPAVTITAVGLCFHLGNLGRSAHVEVKSHIM